MVMIKRAKRHNILVSITSTSNPIGWVEKVKKISELGIEEAALFPTTLKQNQRKELYSTLEKSTIRSIPHVHLRGDMEDWELDLFIVKYNTRFFNIHPDKSKHPFGRDFSKYREKIYVENVLVVPEQKELKKCAGLCIDFSHWEANVLYGNGEYNEKMRKMSDKFPIGCCHVSAVRNRSEYNPKFPDKFSGKLGQHFMESLNDLDYIKKYKKYLPEFVSIELENSIAEQLEAKKYLEKMINN